MARCVGDLLKVDASGEVSLVDLVIEGDRTITYPRASGEEWFVDGTSIGDTPDW